MCSAVLSLFEERGNVLTCTPYIRTLADGFVLGRTPHSCADSSILDELLIENLEPGSREPGLECVISRSEDLHIISEL